MLPSNSLRLRFRQPELPGDLSMIYQLQSDPVAMRYIRPPDQDVEVVKNRVLEWAAYSAQNPGLGVWLLHFIDGGAFAGYCVLREAEWKHGNDLEIGYAVTPDHWGKGLATEIAKALCQYAFDRFKVDFLIAFIDPENAASQRVLEKCGFEPDELIKSSESASLRLKLMRTSFQR